MSVWRVARVSEGRVARVSERQVTKVRTKGKAADV